MKGFIKSVLYNFIQPVGLVFFLCFSDYILMLNSDLHLNASHVLMFVDYDNNHILYYLLLLFIIYFLLFLLTIRVVYMF